MICLNSYSCDHSIFRMISLNNFHIIYHLVKERGFKLDGAKKKLKQNKEEVVQGVEIVRSLQKVREFLTEMKQQL